MEEGTPPSNRINIKVPNFPSLDPHLPPIIVQVSSSALPEGKTVPNLDKS